MRVQKRIPGLADRVTSQLLDGEPSLYEHSFLYSFSVAYRKIAVSDYQLRRVQPSV